MRSALALALSMVLAAFGLVYADAPNLVDFQGRLTDGLGAPLTGSYNLTFSLYNVPTGGSADWTETQTGVAVNAGLFTVQLGSVSPFTRFVSPTWEDSSRYLGISVNGDPELTPRIHITSSAYALRVGTIDGARGGLVSGDLFLTERLSLGPGNYPDQQVHVGSGLETAGRFSTDYPSSSASALSAEYMGISAADGVAVRGKSVPADYYGIGGDFEGGYIGVRSRVVPTGPNQYYGVDSRVTGGTGTNYGVLASAVNSGTAIGVNTGGNGVTAYGVYSSAYSPSFGGNSYGVWSEATGSGNGYGLIGEGKSGLSNFGLYGRSITVSTGTNYGVYATAVNGASGNYAGFFDGNVTVTGTLTKGGGAFKIDHPLDPENKYLQHSFVESPDMMNIYNGNVTTDAHGEAVVTLPAYFDALNRDFRYQLTVIGAFAQAIIGREVTDGKFTINTDKPKVKVSWQVTGIRKDPWANAHRIQVEVAKSPGERGLYLHPEVAGAPADKGLGYQSTNALDLQSEGRKSAYQDSKATAGDK
jgi:hypothetical protein